jgi:tRNA uridine 5-carbamoylmethylation protein Kti12
MPEYARIPVDEGTRARLRRLKRGQQSYDDLLNQMADQYDPPSIDELADQGE